MRGEEGVVAEAMFVAEGGWVAVGGETRPMWYGGGSKLFYLNACLVYAKVRRRKGSKVMGMFCDVRLLLCLSAWAWYAKWFCVILY